MCTHCVNYISQTYHLHFYTLRRYLTSSFNRNIMPLSFENMSCTLEILTCLDLLITPRSKNYDYSFSDVGTGEENNCFLHTRSQCELLKEDLQDTNLKQLNTSLGKYV